MEVSFLEHLNVHDFKSTMYSFSSHIFICITSFAEDRGNSMLHLNTSNDNMLINPIQQDAEILE